MPPSILESEAVMRTRTADIVVIGAGIAGASAAYELSREVKVVLLERETAPGYHSTGRSAALHTENYGNAIIRQLTVASRSFFENLPDGFSEHPVLTDRGVLWIAREDQDVALVDALETGRRHVPSIHEISTAEARRLCPALRAPYLSRVVVEPDAMDLDVHAIHGGFLRGLARNGGELRTASEVLRIKSVGERWEIGTGSETYSAAVIVNAAGAWADEVAQLAGLAPIGITPKRRTAFTFDADGHDGTQNWPVVIDVDEKFYIKPEAGAVLGSPADETPTLPCDVQPEEIDVAVAVDRIERAFDFRIGRIRSKWAGLRCFAPDKSPVVGPDASSPSFFWLAGQGGYGIMTSPALAQMTAGLVLHSAMPKHLSAMGLNAAALSAARLSP